jgi:FkbM family methyltransferase
MTTTLHRLRMLTRRWLKVDVARYPGSDPLHRVGRLLEAAGVTLVMDIGANDGGYATSLRRLGYEGRIVSFEPTRAAYVSLAEAARKDASWVPMQLAIGDQDGETEIHVAGNAAASSSLLPMLDRHREVQPDSAYTHSEKVPVRRLDGLLEEVCRKHDTLFIKLDVQGAEGVVLDGAPATLRRAIGIQAELNLVPLYAGQTPYRHLLDRLLEQGFELVDLIPGFTDGRTGQLLAADGVFMRPAVLPDHD